MHRPHRPAARQLLADQDLRRRRHLMDREADCHVEVVTLLVPVQRDRSTVRPDPSPGQFTGHGRDRAREERAEFVHRDPLPQPHNGTRLQSDRLDPRRTRGVHGYLPIESPAPHSHCDRCGRVSSGEHTDSQPAVTSGRSSSDPPTRRKVDASSTTASKTRWSYTISASIRPKAGLDSEALPVPTCLACRRRSHKRRVSLVFARPAVGTLPLKTAYAHPALTQPPTASNAARRTRIGPD